MRAPAAIHRWMVRVPSEDIPLPHERLEQAAAVAATLPGSTIWLRQVASDGTISEVELEGRTLPAAFTDGRAIPTRLRKEAQMCRRRL